ncbi:hypothetical protein QQG74_12670 [Micromonospora sp. FIMYZ51]|uniref:hypothetical protein n=1 Tax=Micromonospora sp. FIMYZ51 TaxID=3051832 RepID=UPI00311EE405
MARWLAASAALGRPVTDDEPYPHICGQQIDGTDTRSGRPVYLQWRDCAACAQERHQHRPTRPPRPGSPLLAA